MRKNKLSNKNPLLVLRTVLIIICVVAGILYLVLAPDTSIEAMIEGAPISPVATAIVLLLLYAAKSIIMIFPLIALEIIVGHLFPIWGALLVNLIGLFIVLSVPYVFAHAMGKDLIEREVIKHPRFKEIVDRQQSNSFFICYLLRVIGCLPLDFVTMYFGAIHTPYWKNLVAGIIGLLPRMVLATLLGSSIEDPDSPMFWVSIILTILITALSILFYYIYKYKIKNNDRLSA